MSGKKSLGDQVSETFKGIIEWFMDNFIGRLFSNGMDHFTKVGLKNSIPSNLLHTQKSKDKVSAFKAKIKDGPQHALDNLNLLMELVQAPRVETQFKSLTGISTDNDTPVLKDLFTEFDSLRDFSTITTYMGLFGTLMPLPGWENFGKEIRSMFDYSGNTQVTSFGYGQMLAQALGPYIQQEINLKKRSMILDPVTLVILYRRGEIQEPFFLDQMSRH